ncbi:MAG: hypothetical protein NT024_01420, partial [Proteobacteria bacterium]|nr:hypothetical protein [Pseudomonadota bacterium]
MSTKQPDDPRESVNRSSLGGRRDNDRSPPAGAIDEGPPAQTTQNLGRQGGVVASMTFLSRISGLVRDVVLSNFFGATPAA